MPPSRPKIPVDALNFTFDMAGWSHCLKKRSFDNIQEAETVGKKPHRLFG